MMDTLIELATCFSLVHDTVKPDSPEDQADTDNRLLSNSSQVSF